MNYIKDPLYVSVVNPLDKNNIRTYYFLGNIPNNILKAAQSGIYNEQTKSMNWNSENKTILKNFYGPNWKTKLTGEEPIEMKSGFNLYSNKIWGGNEFGDLSIFDQDILTEINEENIKKTETDLIYLSDKGNKITYSNVSVYPEDNLYDLRQKIYLLTKIPIYRQFMFYYVNNQGPYYTYQLTINKIPYIIKWNEMIFESKLNVCGIGIDSYFEQNKKDIDIISFDMSRLLENKRSYLINKVYIIDLFDILKNRDIKLFIGDKYYFDLLYYGFIIKYWPQLTTETFKLAINEPNKITELYPKLSMDFTKLYDREVRLQEIINKTYKYSDHINYSMAITNANMIIYSKLIRMNVNIRNIFDMLELNNNVYAMFINFKYGLRKYKYYSKKHASVMNTEIFVQNNKDTLSICIKGIHQIVLNINRNGSYEIFSQWTEDDLISFDNINDILSKYVNPVINKINEFGALIFPIGGSLNTLKEPIFNMITVSLYYPFIFTLSEFNNLRNSFRIYENIEIIRSQGLQISRTFSFVFTKGIIDFNFVYDSYKWLYEVSTDIGRHVKITHRTDKLQIEIINIKNITEYEIIKRYIFTIIDTYIKDNNIKREKKIDETKIKSIRKLHDLDPELYNLHKFSDKTQAYSILCQSGRQPNIYDSDMIKNLSKEKQQKLVKYWNFTYNKPAYYLCNEQYPYINFIIDKHPKGYCLPCCKKLKDTPGTSVSDINNECLENKIYQSTDKDSSTYILNYGKKLISGRLSHIPNELTKTLFSENKSMQFYIYGVKQNINITDTNIGFISSLKYILGDNCINELAELVKNMEHYYTIGNGKAADYKSAADLYTDIITNFIDYSNSLLIELDMVKWHHIFTDLVRQRYNVEILNIVSENNEYHIKSYQDAVNSIQNNISISFIFIDENGVNPIVSLDPKNRENVVTIFESSICKHFFILEDRPILNLDFMISFSKKYNYIINELYINFKNLCYGINININGNNIYLPILSSIIPYKNIVPLNYGIRIDNKISKDDMLNIIEQINLFRDNSVNIVSVVIYKEKEIGVFSSDQLCYFYNPINYTFTDNNAISFNYDPKMIDESILQKNETSELSETALLKKYYNNLYKLFLSEFSTILQKDKNQIIRTKINNIINKTNFNDNKDIQNLINDLNIVLSKYTIDLNTIISFIEFIYFNSINTDEITKFIDISRFEFDLKLLEDLQNIKDLNVLKNKVHEIMDPYIFINDIETIPQNYNIYTSCINDNRQFFCKESKIIIPKDKVNDLFDALINDILNKSKTYMMIIGSSGIFDYLEFIKRPYEFIEVSDNRDIL